MGRLLNLQELCLTYPSGKDTLESIWSEEVQLGRVEPSVCHIETTQSDYYWLATQCSTKLFLCQCRSGVSLSCLFILSYSIQL